MANMRELVADLEARRAKVREMGGADKIAKQLKYAASRNVPFVVIQGDDERARGEAAIKDMRSGEQTSLPRSGAAAFLRSKLNG